jgi:hypothetical protein
VTAGKLAAGSVSGGTNGVITDLSIQAIDIYNGAVTVQKIQDGAVNSAKILDGTIIADDLDDGAVTTDKIDDLAITPLKLAANAVTLGKINAGAVNAAALANGAVTLGKIDNGAVNAAAIAGDAIDSSSKIKAGTIAETDLDTALTAKINAVGAIQSEVVLGATKLFSTNESYQVDVACNDADGNGDDIPIAGGLRPVSTTAPVATWAPLLKVAYAYPNGTSWRTAVQFTGSGSYTTQSWALCVVV